MNFDNDYWFCIYLDDDDGYVEFTIKSLVKEELDKLSRVVKELGNSEDEIQTMKEEFIDALIYDLTSLKHSERMIHLRRKRLNNPQSNEDDARENSLS